jgi:5-methylcytosine-specific restriction endonuclease McrA
MKRRIISLDIRKELLNKEVCDNRPEKPAVGCKGYLCPLWKSNGGFFDESGKQIDHIVEFCHGGTNDIFNLQVLCPCCHAVKTKRAQTQKWDFTSVQIDNGSAHMQIENQVKRKRSNSF